jgi:hypothetical protein
MYVREGCSMYVCMYVFMYVWGVPGLIRPLHCDLQHLLFSWAVATNEASRKTHHIPLLFPLPELIARVTSH